LFPKNSRSGLENALSLSLWRICTLSSKPANGLIYHGHESKLEILESGKPWSFDDDSSLFGLAPEAHRIQLAYLEMDCMKNWMKNIKIQSKLFLSFSILVVLMIVLTFVAVIKINDIHKEYDELVASALRRQTYVADAIGDLMRIRFINISKLYLTDETALTNVVYEFNSGYDTYTESFIKNMTEYRDNVVNNTSLPKAAIQKRLDLVDESLRLFVSEYHDKAGGLDNAIQHTDRARAEALLLQIIPIGNLISDKLQQLRGMAFSMAEERAAKVSADVGSIRNSMLIISCFFIIFSTLAAIIVVKSIRTPISRIKLAMNEIAGGNLTFPIRSEYGDELGELSNNIGDMVDTITEMNKAVATMDYIDTMVCVTDLGYNIIYINQNLKNILGVEKEYHVNKKKCYKAIRNFDHPCSFCQMEKLLPNKDSFPTVEYENVWDESLGAWIGGRASIIRWIDGQEVLINAFNDVSAKKDYDEKLQFAVRAAEAASVSKSAFLANMSHEIRTPMNSIVGFTELAMDKNNPPNTSEYLIKIFESSNWLLEIINDILDISKIEAGKMELEHIPFDLHELFMNCQFSTQPIALEKGLSLYFYAEPSIGKKLLGDPTRLRQVLTNLLTNSIKFTNVGTIKLSASVIDSADDHCTLHFDIRDSGIGMTQEQIDRVAEPFVQADISTTRKYGGTGLGLSITKSIIELMGGRLLIESMIGVGSKFSFEITFSTIDDADDIPHHKSVIYELEKPNFEGEILFCEDNEMNQSVLRDHLERVGIKTVIAADGKQGVDLVRNRVQNGEKPFDLIFMDIHMPVMDGFEAAFKIAEMETGTPIVAMTANIMATDKELYKKSGMQEYVGKPFTSQELWRCLLNYLKPVNWETINENQILDNDKSLLGQMQKDFVTYNQDTYANIKNAVDTGNIKQAFRMAHTLKSNAGQIHKPKLHEIAKNIEHIMMDGKSLPSDDHMRLLEAELKAVLLELLPLLDETEITSAIETGNSKKICALIEKLEPLLIGRKPQCLDYVDEICSTIPGAEELVYQMENFDFKLAHITLIKIRNIWGEGKNG